MTTISNGGSQGKRKVAPVEPDAAVVVAQKRPRVARDSDTHAAAKVMTNMKVAATSTTERKSRSAQRDTKTRRATVPVGNNNNNNNNSTPTAKEVADYVKQLQDPVQLQQQLDAFPTTTYLAPPIVHYTSPPPTIPCSRPIYCLPQKKIWSINTKTTATTVPPIMARMYLPLPPGLPKKKSSWKIPAALLVSTILVMTRAFVPTPRLLLPTPVSKVSDFIPPWVLPRVARTHSHIIPPSRHPALSKLTLRQFLLDPGGFHVGMAPSFFGFYGYFGTLAAWEHAMSLDDVHFLREQIKGVAGASAGAMAAVLLAAGVSPRTAATHCESLTLESYADPPGVLAAFQGHLFEQIMDDFIQQETAPGFSRQLQDGIFPVAVSGFDLKTFTGKILSRGSMAKAARASASFPLLFQPAVWEHEDGTTSYLIDGGIADPMGVAGLAALNASRIVNMVVGQFGETGAQGPSGMPGEVSEVVSISIQNLPKGGPWAMANGPRAVEAARLAMLASLDLPLYKGKEKGHYELHIDASEFVPLP